MKKLLGFALVALMGVFMVSCSGGDGPGAKAKQLFESVKDKLATMPKEELKTKALELAEIIKPVMQKSVEVVAKLFNDEKFSMEDAAKAYQDAGFTADDVQTVQKVIEDFNTEVTKNPAWTELQTDEDFSKQWVAALGMGDMFNEAEETVEGAAEEVTDAAEDAAEEVTETVEEVADEVTE